MSSTQPHYYYKRVFMYGSSQFCGHTEAYFSAHSEHVLIYIVDPRIAAHQNVIRLYDHGALVCERPVRSSQRLVAYYFFWLVNNLRELWRFSRSKETTVVLGGHPVVFFGMSVLRLFRPIEYAYWIGDYFPDKRLVVVLFEKLKKWYARRTSFTFYLSDNINRVMNGTVLASPERHTVMWGLQAHPPAPAAPLASFSILFVGLLRPGQGLETVFDLLRRREDYRLFLIGVGQPEYVRKLTALLADKDLREKVVFPNRFFSEQELLNVARQCHIGVALYDTGTDNFTHYADPGKIKAYAEMHLPVVMTRISCIAQLVEHYTCGVVIDSPDELASAIGKIRGNYSVYQNGIQKFIEHFDYETYYHKAFSVFENV